MLELVKFVLVVFLICSIYCLTMPTMGMGKIFTIGLTSGLAWELPTQASDLKLHKKNTASADKRVDKPAKVNVQPVYQPPVTIYSNPWSTSKIESGSAWGMGTYSHPQNPYPAYIPSDKSSNALRNPQYVTIESAGGRVRVGGGKQSTKFETSDGDDEDNNNNWEHLPAYKSHYLYRKHGTVHRRTRRELFAKIEKFFIVQNKDGKACLLKALCEVNQTNGGEKGTFIEEILRAIFTWIPSENEDEEDSYGYNLAAKHKGNCTEKYPSCKQSVWNPFF